MRLVIRFSYSLFFFLLWTSSFAQQWNLKKDADSIKVFTSHSDDSKFKSIKAVFTVNAKLSQLAYMVMDAEHYTLWQYNTIKSKTLKKISDKEIIYYAEITAPWPISNRDMIARLTFEQNPDTKQLIIRCKSESSFIEPKKGIVRIPSSTAMWTVTQISKSKLEVVYTIQIDPGGSVPAWMVNMVCAEAPYESFMKLKEIIPSVKKRMTIIRD